MKEYLAIQYPSSIMPGPSTQTAIGIDSIMVQVNQLSQQGWVWVEVANGWLWMEREVYNPNQKTGKSKRG